MKRGFGESERDEVEALVRATRGVERMGWALRNPPLLVVRADSEEVTAVLARGLAQMPFAGEAQAQEYEHPVSRAASDDEDRRLAEVISPASPEGR